MPTPSIRWPPNFDPAGAPIHVRNELAMTAPAEAVWGALIRAVDWPIFYKNASGVVVEGGAHELSAGARFTWTTFGVRLKSVVEEFAPMERIAWSARALGVAAWHAWLITATDGGCHVLTEETQMGFLARANALVFPQRMGGWHQRWLEGLQARATSLLSG
ncbi:MAG: hypothetical protein M3T55_12875 [Pseudomonadota bacterium]|nr:hypothetical protein [Pseudomonadota bacterium]